MEKFKKGDKIIALVSTKRRNTQPRVKGKVYIVRDIHDCPNCDNQYVNFGYETKKTYKKCNVCGCSFESEELKWTLSKYYIKENDIQKTLKSALEREDYKLAIMIRDINKEETTK